MIPKVIHYCWFSGDKLPKSIEKCIDSWKRVMPDYKIKCWDKDSFDFDSIPFVRETMIAKKYPTAADYVRLHALYIEGGIYLDADVEVLMSFDSLLNCDFFTGTEAFYHEGKHNYRIEGAIMGSIPTHPFVKACLEHYENSRFFNPDGTRNTEVLPSRISRIAEDKWEYKRVNMYQQLPNNIIIYPTSYFTNTLVPDTSEMKHLYAIHRNAASWMDFDDRGKFFHFCRKHDLMNFYHWVERLKK